MRVLTILSGILMLATGVFCLINPGQTFLVLAFVVGIVMVINGIIHTLAYLVGRGLNNKGDNNGTVKNLLIHKEVDEENHKTKYVRDFETSKPNEKWSTDVSEFHIPAGKLYLAPILDMYNDEIIAYDISSNPDFLQQKRLLNKAFSRFEDLEGLIFHSDQGWQYQMQPWHKALKDKGIIQSMSRKGNCLDNCPIENFFGKLKNEMFYGHEYEFKTLDQLKKAIEDYIDYYNTKRIKVKLKGLTPCEARQQALSLS